MSKPKLKPCPFCGGKARLMKMGYPHWVYCEDCGAQVHGRVVGEEEGEKASIEVWNKRVEVKEAVNMSLPKMGYSKSDIKSATSTLAMLKSANVLHGDFYGAITVALAVMEEAIKENGDD